MPNFDAANEVSEVTLQARTIALVFRYERPSAVNLQQSVESRPPATETPTSVSADIPSPHKGLPAICPGPPDIKEESLDSTIQRNATGQDDHRIASEIKAPEPLPPACLAYSMNRNHIQETGPYKEFPLRLGLDLASDELSYAVITLGTPQPTEPEPLVISVELSSKKFDDKLAECVKHVLGLLKLQDGQEIGCCMVKENKNIWAVLAVNKPATVFIFDQRFSAQCSWSPMQLSVLVKLGREAPRPLLYRVMDNCHGYKFDGNWSQSLDFLENAQFDTKEFLRIMKTHGQSQFYAQEAVWGLKT